MNDYDDYEDSFDDYEEDDDLEEDLDDDFEERLLSEEDDDLDEAVAMDLGEEFADASDDAAEGRRSRRKARKRAAARRAAAARKAGKRRSVAAAKSTQSFRARLAKTYVTQPQLKAVSASLDRKTAINARGVKKVNARVNVLKGKQARDAAALKNRMDRHADAIRKDRVKQKQVIEKLRKDQQMAMMLPMMMQPKAIEINPETPVAGTVAAPVMLGGTEIEPGTKLATAGSDSMSMIWPLMMMGGGEGGGDNNMMMLVMMMAMDK